VQHDDYPVALVRVVVNVDNLRRGMEAEVELTPRINSLLASGYLQLIGHVRAPAPAPAPAVPPVAAFTLTPIPPIEPISVVDDPTPRRPKKRKTDDAGSEGSS